MPQAVDRAGFGLAHAGLLDGKRAIEAFQHVRYQLFVVGSHGRSDGAQRPALQPAAQFGLLEAAQQGLTYGAGVQRLEFSGLGRIAYRVRAFDDLQIDHRFALALAQDHGFAGGVAQPLQHRRRMLDERVFRQDVAGPSYRRLVG